MPLNVEFALRRGLQTLWADGTGPFTGVLTFRAGGIDEQLHEAGSVALIARLAMSAVPAPLRTGTLELTGPLTAFVARGSEQSVHDFLAAVCAALRDLPWSELPRLLDETPADAAAPEPFAIRWAARHRFGHTGIGRLGDGGPRPGPQDLTERSLRTLWQRLFVAGNAVLHTSHESTPDARLVLAPGPRPPRPVGVDTGLPLPAVITGPPGMAMVSLLLPGNPVGMFVLDMLHGRLRSTLLRLGGPATGLRCDHLRARGREILVAFTGHPSAQTRAETLAGLIVDELRSVASTGFTPDEHAAAVRSVEAVMSDREDPRACLDHAAVNLLLGAHLWRPAEHIEAARCLTPELAAATYQVALQTLLVAVPDAAAAAGLALPDVTGWRLPDVPRVQGRRFRPGGLAGLGPDGLVIGDDGMSLTRDGRRRGGEWRDVVGVRRGRGERLVAFASGDEVTVCASDFPAGQAALDLLDAHTAGMHWGDPGILAPVDTRVDPS